MSYLEYWGLEKHPFDSVPDPEMYFSSHAAIENTIAELLFAIEEGNECLAVVVGEAGLGKTLALHVVLNSIDPEKYSTAFLANPDLTFSQFVREILGQLTGERCTTRAKDTLLEEFSEILFKTADEGRKVLVFVDEGNAIRPRNLEKMRLLTNMRKDTGNLLTLIIAGQPKLARMLEHPSRANLFQRIGLYSRLKPLKSSAVVRDYMEHRLVKAGRVEPIFDGGAYEAIYAHSQGIPRLINRISKLALKAGETNGFTSIRRVTIKAIVARFESLGRAGLGAPEWASSMPAREARSEARTGVLDESNSHSAREEEQQGYLPEEECEISKEVLQQLRSIPDQKDRFRVAGQLAAREISEHPEKYQDAHTDPVRIWDELRNQIMRLTH